jgi:hypothetical protein
VLYKVKMVDQKWRLWAKESHLLMPNTVKSFLK